MRMAADPLVRAWAGPIGLLASVWVAIIAMLEPTGSSMVNIWNSSETYAHGYVVMPLSMWLVWRKRASLREVRYASDARALMAIMVLGAVWLAARVAGAMVVEHYALVGLLIASVWALLGADLVRSLLFPLFYLLLMVPSGDSLIDPLISFTADFTVFFLQLLGIPVFREGTYFALPTGNWSVVEACSGIRYFLSSIVLGWLYAYLTYRTRWKQLAFALAAIVVPVVANGFRAVIIVLLGHVSDMTVAVGVDHLIYGWVWFGIVMLTMFWVGNRWREDLQPQALPTTPQTASPAPRPAWTMAAMVLAVLAVFPLYEHHLSSRAPTPSPLAQLVMPAGWDRVDAISEWRPAWQGMDDQRGESLARGAERVAIHIYWYGAQRQGAELINSENRLVREKDEVWRKTQEFSKTVTLRDGDLTLREALIDSRADGQRLVVWHWNRIGGKDNINIFTAKLTLAWNRLLGRADFGATYVLAAPYLEEPAEAEAVLTRFAEAMRPAANAVLDRPRP